MATVTTVPVEVYIGSSYEPEAAILAYFREHRREWNIRPPETENPDLPHSLPSP